jgi:hypothetical protein
MIRKEQEKTAKKVLDCAYAGYGGLSSNPSSFVLFVFFVVKFNSLF